MEEVRRTVVYITRKGQWSHTTSSWKHESNGSTSSSSSESDSNSEALSSDSDSSIEEDFIRMKSTSSHSKKRHTSISRNDKSSNNTGYPAAITDSSEQESREIDSLIKQFGEIKLLLAEAVTKVDKLEQVKNSCKNCRSSAHTTPNCTQLCKVCQGTLDVHIF